MKGLSTIIVMTMIIIVVIALASLAWTFSTNMLQDLTQMGSSSISQLTEAMSSCMNIEGSYKDKLYIRNCGEGVITNNTLNIYIDDAPFSFNMTPSSINSGEIATVSIPLWGLSIGDHIFRIYNSKTEIVNVIEAVLPDSAVLALDFDDGSGTTAKDSSSYGFDGKIYDDSAVECSDPPTSGCPKWINGKFRGALEFNGVNGYVQIPANSFINAFGKSAMTLEAWIYARSDGEGDYAKIVDKANSPSDDTGEGYSFRVFGYNTTHVSLGAKMQHTSTDATRTTSSLVPVYSWHHVLFVYNKNADKKIKIYLDGIEIIGGPRNDAGTGDLSDDTSINLRIGNYAGDITRTFDGGIDSVRIYSEALTPDETVILRIK